MKIVQKCKNFIATYKKYLKFHKKYKHIPLFQKNLDLDMPQNNIRLKNSQKISNIPDKMANLTII